MKKKGKAGKTTGQEEAAIVEAVENENTAPVTEQITLKHHDSVRDLRAEAEELGDEWEVPAGNGKDLRAPWGFWVIKMFSRFGSMLGGMAESYQRMTRVNSDDLAEHFNKKGMAHLKHNRPEKAVKFFLNLIHLQPARMDGYYHLAVAYNQLESVEKAKKCLKKAIEFNPEYAEALFLLGTIHSVEEDIDVAISYLETVARLRPEEAKVYYRLGLAYDSKKKYKQAISHYQKALKLKPRSYKIYQGLGFAYDSFGNHDEAIKYFKKAAELEGGPASL